MHVFRVRRWSRVVAVLLLLATAGAVPHAAKDDAECVPFAAETHEGHRESDHALRAGDREAQDHCAVCHWARSLRTPRAQAAVAAVVAEPPVTLVRPADRSHFPPVLDHLPVRAPPATR